MQDAELVRQVCAAIVRTICLIQQTQPEFLEQTCQSLPLQTSANQTALATKLAARLEKCSGEEGLLQASEALLRRLFRPVFFQSAAFQHLIAELGHLVDAPLEVQANHSASPISQPQPSQDPEIVASQAIEASKAIAILLLDAENLQLDADAEKFLARHCTYPLTVKIAFANWRSLGKQDTELHNRHYDLIHVPGGKDMADGKMITVGSSIHEHYPHAREVVVCSSDKVMTNLCTKLCQCGLVVYHVEKKGEQITLTNKTSHETKLYGNQIPSLADCISQVKHLIQAEQKQTSQWVKLSKVSQLFKQHFGVTLSQVIAMHNPGEKVRDLFERHQDFVLKQHSEQSEWYITLFEVSSSESSLPQTSFTNSTNVQSAATSDPVVSQLAPSSKITLPNTPAELKTVLVQIVKDQTVGAPRGSIREGMVATQFYKLYGQGIKKILNQLDVKQTFPAFLSSCEALKVEQTGNEWLVQIRN